jgi:hypothetical protein
VLNGIFLKPCAAIALFYPKGCHSFLFYETLLAGAGLEPLNWYPGKNMSVTEADDIAADRIAKEKYNQTHMPLDPFCSAPINLTLGALQAIVLQGIQQRTQCMSKLL